ncbi:hypothetical protein MRX96_008802 [Rhipicephalus microplus]
MAMVEEETRRYRPTKNYLEHLPQLSLHQFESEIMKTESERLQSRLPMEMTSMKCQPKSLRFLSTTLFL